MEPCGWIQTNWTQIEWNSTLAAIERKHCYIRDFCEFRSMCFEAKTILRVLCNVILRLQLNFKINSPQCYHILAQSISIGAQDQVLYLCFSRARSRSPCISISINASSQHRSTSTAQLNLLRSIGFAPWCLSFELSCCSEPS